MSCDWDFFCRDCKAPHGLSDANHEAEALAAIWAQRERFETIWRLQQDLINEVSFVVLLGNYDNRRISLKWMHDHKDHDVIVRSEYGDIFNACNVEVKCSHCGVAPYGARCRLPKGHPTSQPHQA